MMKTILRYYVRVCMFLLPIFFLPVITDPFGFGKNLAVMVTGAIGLILWGVSMVIDRSQEVKVNKIFLMVLALVVWGWVSWWRVLQPGVRLRSVMDVGGVGTLTAVAEWFFLWYQVKSKEEEKQQLNWLTAAGVLVTITSIVVFLVPTSKLPIVWPKDTAWLSIDGSWSMTGSILGEIILLGFLAVEWGKRLAEKVKGENVTEYVVEAVLTGVLSLAVLLDIYRLFKTGWVNLDTNSAWVIAVESFKRNPIWGIGIGNFMEAFNKYRPDTYNVTKFWANGFRTSASGILQIWTELGVVAMAILAILSTMIIRLKKDLRWYRLVALGLVATFLPMNLVGILMLVWALGEVAEGHDDKMVLSFKVGEKELDLVPIGLLTIFVISGVISGYWLGRLVMGEVYMRQSMVAASKNDGGGTYNLQIKAIGMDMYDAEYRRVYSQTNLALAKAILSNSSVTDDDKQKASVLIQQSVREGKSAIALDSQDPSYWTNLAVIYRNLIGVVDGSPDWSFQAYQQAVALDSMNPLLKLDLGGLLYAANRFDEADRVFEQTVTVKPDFANAWYNWAYSAKQNGRLADAVARLTQAVALVPKDSGDYSKASAELATWQKELDEAIKKQNAAVAAQQAALATPTPSPESLKTAEPLPTVNKKNEVAVPTGELAPPTPADGEVATPTAKPTTKPKVKPSPTIVP